MKLRKKKKIHISGEIAEIRELVKNLQNQFETVHRDMQKYKEKAAAIEAVQPDVPEQPERSLKPEKNNNRTKGDELTR